MGRLGKLPVQLTGGVTYEVKDSAVVVTGPKGSLTRKLPREVELSLGEDGIVVTQKGNSKVAKAGQGSTRAHIANMVRGVSEGWKKQLEINGPGYRAEVRGKDLVLSVGYSHPVIVSAPEGITFTLEKNIVTVDGFDKEKVGHVSALVRDTRRPNPYTGSGIRYTTEVVRRKAGKQAGKTE